MVTANSELLAENADQAFGIYLEWIEKAESIALLKYLTDVELFTLEGMFITKHMDIMRRLVRETGQPRHSITSDELKDIDGYLASIHKEKHSRATAKKEQG